MSSTPARAFMSPSNLRLSRSRSWAFFSTSVLRRRDSASYLAMSASLPCSSEVVALSFAPSCALCETVLRASTLSRASSFCSCAPAISLSCTPSRTCSASRAVLAVPFSTAICSPRLDMTASSIFFASRSVRCSWVSSAATSAVSVECCWLTLLSSMSVCSSDRLSIANFSLCCSSLCRTSSCPAMTIFISASSLFCVATSVSFFSCSVLIIFLSPRTSPSIACSYSRCLCSAVSVACSASSRRCMPSNADFHWARSCVGGLQRLVTPLHAEQRGLPLGEKLLLLVVDRLHLLLRVAQRLVGSSRLAALRDELCLVKGELLLAALELLVELVDEVVLRTLTALELRDRLLCLVRRSARDCDLALHLLV